MKNNMILMLAAIIAMFTLAVALYGASATLLGQAPATPAGGDNKSGDVTQATGDELPAGTEAMKTAFGALTASSADPAVKAWMADKKIVYVASISSDFCDEGLSDTWTVSFASDDGQIIACTVRGEVIDARQSRSSPQQGLDPGKVIDSAEIWQKVAGQIIAAGGEVPPSASMTLKVTGGQPRWDVSYEAADGLHVVRIDAGNGIITDKVTIGQG
jgi:ABC-type Na+ efflux pump permease subunit